MYNLELDEVFKAFKKLAKKDKTQLEAINKKLSNTNRSTAVQTFEASFGGAAKVHIGSFVLIYEVFEDSKAVRVLKYTHHDNAYL